MDEEESDEILLFFSLVFIMDKDEKIKNTRTTLILDIFYEMKQKGRYKILIQEMPLRDKMFFRLMVFLSFGASVRCS